MRQPPGELLEFLFRYDPAIQALTVKARELVVQELAPCHEYIFEMRSKVVLLYGATDRVIADGICNIGVFRHHITVGFPCGTDLRDPGGSLQGTGKAMRHLRLTALTDLRRPEIRTFLGQARAGSGLRPRRGQAARELVTRIKPRSLKPLPFGPRTP